MRKILFDKFGRQIIQDENKLLCRFDGGGIVSVFYEYEITSEEAEKAMRSLQDFNEILKIVMARNKQDGWV